MMHSSGYPLLCAILLLAHAQAWAAVGAPTDSSDSAIEHAIEIVLDERHPTDTPAWWRSLGPSAPRIIISMYEDSTHIYHRLRLIQALGYFDDPSAAEFLKKQALDANDDVIRNAAITSVGLSQGAREESFIARFLQNDDPQARVTAALALKRIGDAKAQSLLDQFYKEEKVAWVKDKVKQEQIVPAQAPLQIVKREERKLTREFAGAWSGFWIEPNPDDEESGPSLTNFAVSLKLKFDDKGELSGQLSVKKRGLNFRLENVVGKDRHIAGILWTSVPKGSGQASPNAARAEFAFQADLFEKDDVSLIRLVLPQSLGTMVLRKSQ